MLKKQEKKHKNTLMVDYQPEINKWWEEHKKLDAKRVALAKLTPEERKLLGVKDA